MSSHNAHTCCTPFTPAKIHLFIPISALTIHSLLLFVLIKPFHRDYRWGTNYKEQKERSDSGGIQTHDLQNRNLTLYSAKLPSLMYTISHRRCKVTLFFDTSRRHVLTAGLVVSTKRLFKRYIPSERNVYTFHAKPIYLSNEIYIPFEAYRVHLQRDFGVSP